jgi:Flavivirus envelope glycoprotein M
VVTPDSCIVLYAELTVKDPSKDHLQEIPLCTSRQEIFMNGMRGWRDLMKVEQWAVGMLWISVVP